MADSLLQRALGKQGSEKLYKRLSPAQREALRYQWEVHARPEQLPPLGDWRIWLFCAGRGSGKTRSASEWVRWLVENGKAGHVALVAKTPADARDVMVEEGESSILKTARPNFRPKYEPSKRRLTWPNGATATIYSAEEPDQLRGPQHDAAWVDELAKFPKARKVWDNLMFGLRVLGPDGSQPRCLVTTTPRPTKLIVELAKGRRQPDGSWKARSDVVVTTASTYDNRQFLAPGFLEEIENRYEGTRLGRQELHAKLLEDVVGALWTLEIIDDNRADDVPELDTVVVGVDPATTATEESSETGIAAAGRAGSDYYVLADRSCRRSPGGWASRAIATYQMLEADSIIAEANQGGDMVKHTLHTVDASVPIRLVHASRGKRTRAEPVAALYEQGRVHHVGLFPELEDQLTTWIPGEKSPDRLDALVWAISALRQGWKPGRVGIRVIG